MILVVGVAAGAWADHAKSTLQILAENPKARFNPKVQVLLIEERLQRPAEIDLYPLSLQPNGHSAVLDQQVRRLGELIRRQDSR
jgi:hypothetical protein